MSLKVQQLNARGSTHAARERLPIRGFTLIELIVVVAIIVILVAIAVPAVGPAMSVNQQTQAIQTLTNAIVLAQTRAENRGGCAIRIERAFKTDSRGYMVDAKGQTRDNAHSGLGTFDPNTAPVWLDYQQIRFLNPPKDGRYYQPALEEPVKLPKNIWVAPDYALDKNNFDWAAFFIFQNWKVPSSVVGSTVASTKVNPFHTFCIVFDQRGNVVEFRNSVLNDSFFFLDTTQPDKNYISPQVSHLYNSARGVIVYDHNKFENLGTNSAAKYDFLAREGRFMYINRFLGTLVETRNQ